MKAGMAMTTTQAPSVNLETRKTMVAMAVMHAPKPLMAARRRQPVGRSRHQCTTSPACESVNPMNTPMAKRGMRVLVLPSDGDEERARHDREYHDAVAERLPVAPDGEEVGEVVVPCHQAGQDGEPAEGRVGGQGQHDRDGDGDDVVGPAPADGHGHDLAQDGLAGAGSDVPALGQDGEAEQHGAEDEAEQDFGPLGPHGPRLPEQGHPVGDRLHAGQRAAPGGEGLEDQEERHRLEPGRGQSGTCRAATRSARGGG